MKTIKQGVHPHSQKIYRGCCDKCGAVYEAESQELHTYFNKEHEIQRGITCKTEGCIKHVVFERYFPEPPISGATIC